MSLPNPFSKVLATVAISLLLIQCAQKRPLSGGSKDTDPPKLVRSSPDTMALNFNTDFIKMEFDEFIKLDNIQKNLLITPVLRYEPNVTVSGKKLFIRRLDDSLWSNTTYVMEFNEAIRDITENNAKKGFRYVFSTGAYLDSLEINGLLKDAFTLKPIEDAYVFLYEKSYDSIPYLEKPRYIGRTNKEGQFTIRNMKAGNYKVFMATDDNRNYLYDRPSDKIDFLDSNILISADTGQFISGRLFKEDKGNQALKSYGISNKWAYYLSFNRPVDSLIVESTGEDLEFIKHFVPEMNDERDSVVYWLQDTLSWKDNWKFIVKGKGLIPDTIEMQHFNDKRPKSLTIDKNLQASKLDLNQNLELYFKYPLIEFKEEKLKLLQDSLEIEFKSILSESQRGISIEADWNEGTSYTLVTDSGAFFDVYATSNDSSAMPFSTREKKYYGTMDISLNGLKPGNGILQIMDQKGNIIEKVLLDSKQSYYFEYLNPGEYFLKYIVDENANGKWDPGNYLKKLHAEPVFIYQGSITIRSNWDQVIEWKFN